MKDLVAQLSEVTLNLPSYTMNIEKGDQGKYFVFDPIRKKIIINSRGMGKATHYSLLG